MVNNKLKLVTIFILITFLPILELNIQNYFHPLMFMLLPIIIFYLIRSQVVFNKKHIQWKKKRIQKQISANDSLTFNSINKIKRTKFFFGYRYMWARCQINQHCKYIEVGVRKDVAAPLSWAKKISEQMEKQNIMQKNFKNSITIDVYHDGKQGLFQHFNDAVRFKRVFFEYYFNRFILYDRFLMQDYHSKVNFMDFVMDFLLFFFQEVVCQQYNRIRMLLMA